MTATAKRRINIYPISISNQRVNTFLQQDRLMILLHYLPYSSSFPLLLRQALKNRPYLPSTFYYILVATIPLSYFHKQKARCPFLSPRTPSDFQEAANDWY